MVRVFFATFIPPQKRLFLKHTLCDHSRHPAERRWTWRIILSRLLLQIALSEYFRREVEVEADVAAASDENIPWCNISFEFCLGSVATVVPYTGEKKETCFRGR